MTHKTNLPRMPDWIMCIQRSYAQMLGEVFDEIGNLDLTPQQAIMIACIGDGDISATHIRMRGYYIGQNVTYNLKKLEEVGYLERARPKTDRRCNMVRLTPRGLQISAALREKLARVREAA